MERRIFTRATSSLPCTVELTASTDSGRPHPLLAQFDNISGGGCSLLCTEALPLGEPIRLSVYIADEGELSLVGRVKHVATTRESELSLYVLGIEFEEMDEKSRNKLFWYAMQNRMV